MQIDLIFKIINAIVVPQWLLMIFLPLWRPTLFLLKHPIFPLGLSLAYLIFIGGSSIDIQSIGSLRGLKTLFDSEKALLAGWIHYLAFDLLVGSFLLRKCIQNNFPAVARVLVLLLTFMMGPLGLLTYYAIGLIQRKREKTPVIL